MKHIRKLLALVLAALLLCSVLPSAFAADSKVIASGGLNGITWTLTEDGDLTVSGNGPIADKDNYEYDENGEVSSIEKIDCIGWQIDACIQAMEEGLSAKDASLLRHTFVKTLILEEGITSVPDGEFDIVYPRTIILPATLQTLGNASINAQFTESLIVNGKDTVVNGGLYISAYRTGETPYASIDKAVAAVAKMEAKSAKIEQKMNIVYDTGLAFEIKEGLYKDMTKKEFLATFNETYGKSYTKLSQCISFGIKRINKTFGTNYSSINEIFTVINEEDGSYSIERDEKIDDVIGAMHDANDITARLDYIYLGEIESGGEKTAYQWLTVSAPSGSNAEKAAKTDGLPFNATTPPEKVTFLQKVQQFFEKLKTRLEVLVTMFKLSLPHFDLPKLF